MPIQQTKGLPGLKGWGSLSSEEKEAFMSQHPDMRGLSMGKQIAAYRNQQFIDRFGVDAFNQYNRQQRDQMYKAAVVGDEIDKVFKDDENYSAIKSLTADSQYELLQSDYLNQKQSVEETKERKENFRRSAFGAITLVPGKIYLNAKEKIAQTKSDSILNGIQAKDTQRKADSVSGDTRGIANNISAQISNGELNAEDFNKAFEDVAGNSAYYNAFKNAHELQYYSLDDKIKDYAEFVALQQRYGTDAAIQRLNTKTQQRVVDNQTAWDWWGSAAQGIAGKTVGSFGQLITGIQALYNVAQIGVTQGENAAKAWLANFLEGKDENGNERAWYDNLKYWNGVDQFGTFDPNKINEIYNSGGISNYNWQSEAGKEMNLSSALNEGLKMVGYVVAQTLVARGAGAIGKGAAKLTGGVFNAATGMYEVAQSSKAANAIMKYVTPGVSSAINAIPISVGYAKGSYDEVLQQATDRAEKEAGNYAMSHMKNLNDTINDGIALTKNGFAAMKGSNLESVASELNNMVVNEYNNRIQQGEKPEDIDVKELYNNALVSYKDARLSNYYNEFKQGDTYKQMVQAARQEAASAYERNATIEFLRMCGVNYLFKQYQQDKSVRAAMNSNYPNLEVVDRGGKLAATGKMLGSEVSTKTARLAQPLKTLWGGFESNFMDDVTAKYAQGFSLGRYNDYVNQLLDPDKTAATVSWMAGFTNALAQAEGAFLDKQSWYDGFIGALGSGEVLAPSRGLFRGLRGESWQRNNYSETQLANMASKYGISIEQYINGEFDSYVKRRNPRATDAQIADEVSKIRKEDGFEKAVQDGRIERVSVGEWINNRIYNPLLSQYAESAERERQFQSIIDGGNKAIAEKRAAIEDMLRVVYASNRKVTADKSGDIFDGEEAKAHRAFELVSLLSDWSSNPVLSQSEFVQQSWAKTQDQAQGKITEADIADFYSAAENKSERDRADANEFATQRLQSNAQQLVKMRESYENAIKKVKESDNYRVINQHNAANRVARQLAFNEAILENRKERKAQMEHETGLVANESSHIAIAEYGSRAGAENALEAINEDIEAKKKEINTINALLNGEDKGPRALRRLNKQANELYVQELQRQLNQLERDKSRINTDIENNVFDRVLSADEILALSSKQRAKMLDKDNRRLYSKEQLAEIDEATKQLELRDPNALSKVRDIARLQEAIEDTETSQYIMQNNMEAAADYYQYMQDQRDYRTRDALARHHYREVADAVLNAESDEIRTTIAKGFSSAMLDKFIKEHSEYAELLKGTKEVVKVSEDITASLREVFREESENINSRVRKDGLEDTEEDTARKKEEVAQTKGTIDGIWENIRDEVVVSPNVVDENSMMGVLEDLADRQQDPRVKAIYNRILEKLEKKKHARNSTVVDSRKAKEAEKQKKQQAAFNADGKNFGWDGYVVGDTVYHKDGREGRVAGFVKAGEGESNGSMKVAWNGQAGLTVYKDKSIISKTKPEIKKEENQQSQQAQPTQPDSIESESIVGRTDVPDWEDSSSQTDEYTEDGGYLAPSEEEQFEADSSESESEPAQIQEGYAIDKANEDSTNKNYRATPGLLEGNALYRYTADLLKNLGIIEERTADKGDDSMSLFFNWLKEEGIQLQEIIDRELFAISKTNPDIQFLYMRGAAFGKHLVQVVEYNDKIKAIHDEKLGGVIVSGEGEDAKEYLVVGTTYSHNGMDKFNAIYYPVMASGINYFNSHPNAKYYVNPDVHSKIAKIDAGRLIKRQLGEDSVKFRKLSELFSDLSRNPSKISFENAVLGIIYNDKFFVPNRAISSPMFSPGKSDSTVGRVFLMIPAANGNYIPVALKTKITIPELTEGAITRRLREGILPRLASPDVEIRRRAVKDLSRIIVMKSANGKVIDGFLVGDENHNNVTLVRNGVNVKSWMIDRNFDMADFVKTVMNSPFEANVTMRALKNPGALKELDEAGILQTDVSTLRTANASYQIFEVDSYGKPVEVEVKQPVSQTQKENPSRIDRSTTINGSVYRLISGEYYDELNNVITDKELRNSIHYNLLIQQKGLKSAYTSTENTDIYVINDDINNPTVISKDKNGNIKVFPKERAVNELKSIQERNDRIAKMKAAEEELQRIEESEQENERQDVTSWDEEESQAPEQAPQEPAKPVYIEPKHGDNVVYGPAIKETKIHNKWERKDYDAELHTKTTTATDGTKNTKVVGWGTDGLEVGLVSTSNEAAILEVPDGYAISKEELDKHDGVIGISEIEERPDGTVRAMVAYKDGLGFSYGWTTLERAGESKTQKATLGYDAIKNYVPEGYSLVMDSNGIPIIEDTSFRPDRYNGPRDVRYTVRNDGIYKSKWHKNARDGWYYEWVKISRPPKNVEKFFETVTSLQSAAETKQEQAGPVETKPIVQSKERGNMAADAVLYSVQTTEKPKVQEKPKSNYDPNKATTKSLKQLQEEKKVITFGQLYSRMRKELNAIAQEKGWNWGKTAKEKEAFLKEKLGENFHPEAISDVETFIENLKNCK